MGLPKDCEIKKHRAFKPGIRNLITDVPGVKVGQVTLIDGERHIHTGVTAILPHGENLFRKKVLAGASVINGFGKSAGLIQIDELGNIESPIIMTNTFAVGTALNAVTRYMLDGNEDIGAKTGTVNCVITECNDGEINDIRGMHVTEKNVLDAIANCGEDFQEGAVGAGTGMVCMGLKGGIGSASRVLSVDGKDYIMGSIMMSNFGMPGNLVVDGQKVATGKVVGDTVVPDSEKGSAIIIIATNIPLNERQLRRVAKRSTVALARTGSYLGNGSGDIGIAFSTANTMPHYSETNIIETKMFNDDKIDQIFEATADVVEEAIISSLYHAETVEGIRGNKVYGLREFLGGQD